jgi:hypothetical protein
VEGLSSAEEEEAKVVVAGVAPKRR